MRGNYILGAGVTGIAANIATGYPILEQGYIPGGICQSNIIDGYLFEGGGGHWIFGDTPEVISHFHLAREYRRKAAVYISRKDKYYPYPIQSVIKPNPQNINVVTMEDWLLAKFGSELCELFFFPFNDRYTDGLYYKIAPQDNYKNPVIDEKGYNEIFSYPSVYPTLGYAMKALLGRADIRYGNKVAGIILPEKLLLMEDGKLLPYDKVVSTIPLCYIFDTVEPYTSVHILNIGAIPGRKLPDYHWIYIPDSDSGFYRVGIYSNVDKRFAPKNRCSLYVEIAGKQDDLYQYAVIKELQSWDYIRDIDVITNSVIDVAYTYQYPGSTWRDDCITKLKAGGVQSVGRYGGWKYQGISQSFMEGLNCGK
jgi:protoporphyrinogen oxidase